MRFQINKCHNGRSTWIYFFSDRYRKQQLQDDFLRDHTQYVYQKIPLKKRRTIKKIFLAQGSRRKSQEVTLGESVYLSCGLQQPDDQYFCHFYDPKAELVQSETRCSLTLDMVTSVHIGTWKCRIGVPYLMETPVYEVELIQKGKLTE